jgi:hypothetical protein
MRRLHRLVNDCYELLTQLAQVYFITQRGAEGRYDFGCVIFAAVEAPINELLETMA